jgi:hypothetical protein
MRRYLTCNFEFVDSLDEKGTAAVPLARILVSSSGTDHILGDSIRSVLHFSALRQAVYRYLHFVHFPGYHATLHRSTPSYHCPFLPGRIRICVEVSLAWFNNTIEEKRVIDHYACKVS